MTIDLAGPRRTKFESLQLLRGAAALLVLLYHLTTTAAYGWLAADAAPRLPLGMFAAVGFAGVDLFFVISGVVMVVTCYDRCGRPGESLAFLRRRIVRIYPLYWMATVAVLAICWLRPDVAARDKFDAASIVRSLVLWPQPDFPIVAVGWTLVYEMFFYLVFAILIALPRSWAPSLLAAWTVMTIALWVVHESPERALTAAGCLQLPPYASPLVLEFIAGCVVGRFALRHTLPAARPILWAGAAMLAIVGAYVGMTRPEEAQFGWIRTPVFGIGAALIVYGAVGWEQRTNVRIPRWATFWGDASYSTYLTHMYVLMLVATAWTAWSPWSGPASAWTATAVGIAGCALAAGVCHLAVERPLQAALKRRRSTVILAYSCPAASQVAPPASDGA